MSEIMIPADREASNIVQWTPTFVQSVDEAVAVVKQREEFLTKVLRKDIDYGVIPGTGTKPTLLKPGAERVLAAMGLSVVLEAEGGPVLDFIGTEEHGNEPFIFYQRRAVVYKQLTPTEKMLVASASGSCSSRETKYRYRQGERKCPSCGQAAIIKGKAEYGGGWLCFAKKGGCGAKFDVGDQAIEGQAIGRVPNPDIADVANTILKMADKRALVAAAIMATGYSDYLTQDIEDLHPAEGDDDGYSGALAPQPPPRRASRAPQAAKTVVHEGTATAVAAPAPAPAQAQPGPTAQATATPEAPATPPEYRNNVGQQINDLIKQGVTDGTLTRDDFGKMVRDAKIDAESLKQYDRAWYHYADQDKAEILLHLLKSIVGNPEEVEAMGSLPMG